MGNRQNIENQILERLNQRTGVHVFIQEVIALITEAIDQLMLKVFRKDDYAVKYAVEPLLTGTGPLSEISVRLKLLFALGAIKREAYEDIELIIVLNRSLTTEDSGLNFIDDKVLNRIKLLNCMEPLPEMMQFTQSNDIIDTQLIDLQKYRYQQMVKSSLVLSVTCLITQLFETDVF